MKCAGLLKYSVYVILFTILVLSVLNLLKPITYSFWPDFNIYYHSAQAAAFGKNPYTLPGIFIGGYLYQPVSLFVFYPFLLFPVVIAGRLWILLSIVSLLTGVWLLLKLFDFYKNYVVLCIAGILVCNFFPVKFTLGMGQLNTIIFLLVVGGLYFLKKKQEGLFGVILGITLTVKYFPTFICFYLVLRRKLRMGIALIGTSILLLLFGILILQPETTIYFFQHIFFSLVSSVKIDYYNQALSGFLLRDFRQLSIIQITTLRLCISVIMLLITSWFIVRNTKYTKPQLLEISLFIILSLLLNTFSWQHQFVLLLIPFFVTYFMMRRNKFSWKYYAILAVSYVLVAMNAKHPNSLPVVLQSHVFYGAFILWLLDLYMLYKSK